MQVLEVLKHRIINGEYPIGSLMPSETSLKNEFKVSIITVRRAVEELALQGYVEKKSGVGTTVLENKAIAKLSKETSFSDYLMDNGYHLQKEFIDVSKVDIKNDPILAKFFSNKSYCIERLYYLNNEPFIHFEHYVSDEIALPEGVIHFEDSLYEIMYEQGVQFKRYKDELSVAVPTKRIADYLQIEEKPLLNRKRYAYDIEGKMIEYSVAFFNTAMHKYVINLIV